MNVPLVLIVIGCGGGEAPSAAPPAAPPTEAAPQAAPTPTSDKPPPVPGEGDVEAGSAIFAQYCVPCHQADGTGMNGMLAANFNEPERLKKSDVELLTSIRDGFQGKTAVMPPWGGTLDDQQMRDALAYIRATFPKEK